MMRLKIGRLWKVDVLSISHQHLVNVFFSTHVQYSGVKLKKYGDVKQNERVNLMIWRGKNLFTKLIEKRNTFWESKLNWIHHHWLIIQTILHKLIEDEIFTEQLWNYFIASRFSIHKIWLNKSNIFQCET